MPCVMETDGAQVWTHDFAGPPSRPVAVSGHGGPHGGSTGSIHHPLPSALSPQSRRGLSLSTHLSQQGCTCPPLARGGASALALGKP